MNTPPNNDPPPPGTPPAPVTPPDDPLDLGADDAREAFREAAHQAREIVEFTAGQVQDVRRTLRSLDSPYLWGVFLLLVVAAASGMSAVLSAPFRDWYMHLAMYVVLALFALLYAKSHYRRRAWARFLWLVVFVALSALWVAVLWDAQQPRRLWFADRPIERGEVTALWAPIVAQSMAALALVLHTLLAWYEGLRRRDQSRRAGSG
jgi:hypothetical protein